MENSVSTTSIPVMTRNITVVHTLLTAIQQQVVVAVVPVAALRLAANNQG